MFFQGLRWGTSSMTATSATLRAIGPTMSLVLSNGTMPVLWSTKSSFSITQHLADTPLQLAAAWRALRALALHPLPTPPLTFLTSWPAHSAFCTRRGGMPHACIRQ